MKTDLYQLNPELKDWNNGRGIDVQEQNEPSPGDG